MNCAYLKVVGTATSYTGPQMFVANTGKCTTTEGVEISYPNPGDSVEYGGGYSGNITVPSTSDCATMPGNNNEITVFANGGSSGLNSSSSSTLTSSTTASNTSSTSSSTTKSTTSSTSTHHSSSSSSSTSSSHSATTTSSSTCLTGAILCSSDGLSWSVCINGGYVNLGAVSSGTKCINGAIVCGTNANTVVTTTAQRTTMSTTKGTSSSTASASTCTPGQIKCSTDGKSWSMCSNGAYVYMGSVAPGISHEAFYIADLRYDLHERSDPAEEMISGRGIEHGSFCDH